MGTFVAALFVLVLFCGIHLSYVYSFTDGQDRLYDLDGFGYSNVYPFRRYNSIEPYRFAGLGHSEIHNSKGSDYNDLRANGGNSYSNLGIFGGSGYSNLGTIVGNFGSVYNTLYGGSGYSNLGSIRGSHGSVYNTLYGDSGYSNLGTIGGSRGSVYNTLYGDIGYSNLGTYGGSGVSVYNTLYGGSGHGNLGAYGSSVYNTLYGGSGGGGGRGFNSLRKYLSDNSRLGQYQFGGYNSLYDIDDFGLGDSLLRYSSLGSSPPRSTDTLESHNYFGGYSNLEQDLFGGYNIGNDVARSIYTPSSFLRTNTYSPEVYYVGNQNVRRRPRNRSSYK
ncbi:hypothetical protein ACJMK2_011713 [Sinanodonta woodiana]|uniref:Uncharacterized protein n=1 Tax=Sinanodonta woodiana TaxID=1069815 RepID=A0ABD3V6A8_SINWO